MAHLNSKKKVKNITEAKKPLLYKSVLLVEFISVQQPHQKALAFSKTVTHPPKYSQAEDKAISI